MEAAIGAFHGFRKIVNKVGCIYASLSFHAKYTIAFKWNSLIRAQGVEDFYVTQSEVRIGSGGRQHGRL
jgi:hypothetical protein